MSDRCPCGVYDENCNHCQHRDDEVERLRKRVEELERELNPDPEAHLMGWEGDDD